MLSVSYELKQGWDFRPTPHPTTEAIGGTNGDGETRTRVTDPPCEWNGLALPVIPVRLHRQLKAGAAKLMQGMKITLIDNLQCLPVKMSVFASLDRQRPAAIMTGDNSYAVVKVYVGKIHYMVGHNISRLNRGAGMKNICTSREFGGCQHPGTSPGSVDVYRGIVPKGGEL